MANAGRIKDQLKHLDARIAVLDDGSVQIVTGTGRTIDLSGVLSFPGKSYFSSILNPYDYGVKADGSTDDTVAVQAVCDAANTKRGAIIQWPSGSIIISSPIDLLGHSGTIFRGTGSALRGNWGTQFQWVGTDPTVPAFKVRDTNHARFQDFSVRPLTIATPLHSGFWLENPTATGVVTPQRTIWDNVVVNGSETTGASCGRGWVTINSTGDTDANNDFHYFENCQVSNVGVAGWLFNHSQSKAHLLVNCGFTPGNTLARCAVGCGYDWDYTNQIAIPVTTGGSFKWIGGQISRSAEAAFVTSTNGDIVTIDGANIENPVRLLLQGGAAAAATAAPVTRISNTRCAFTVTAGVPSLHADGGMIVQNSRGIISCDALLVQTGGTIGEVPQIIQAPSIGTIASYAICEIKNSHIETGVANSLIGAQNAAGRIRIQNCTYRVRPADTYGNYDNGDYGAGMLERWGAGSPEGAITAIVGSVYHRSDGGVLTAIYVKETGTGNTGWVGK